MKKINLIAAVLAAVMAAVFSGCSSDIIGESSGIFLRQSTTAVSNLKATAYEGAIVLTWSYNADLAGGFLITRTDDGAEKTIYSTSSVNYPTISVKPGESYYVDYYGDTNQLENGKNYTYTVYTLPSSSSAVIDKSASASASAAAIIKRPSGKLEQWDKSEITAKWKEYDGKIWVVVTRPDSYAYGYSATLTVEYEYKYTYKDNTGTTKTKTVVDSTTITTPTYTGLNSTKKDGKDGTAKDYYKIVKGSSWTNIRGYTLSAAKSLSGASSLLGFYKDSDETNVVADKDTSIEDIGGNEDNTGNVKVSVADLAQTLNQTDAGEVGITITDSKPDLSQIETAIKNHENIKIKLDLSQCTGLTNITGFYNCSSLTGITIPNTVTVIAEETFGYSGLTTITIPDSVTTIDEEAFYDCSNLTSVTIGSGVTSIGDAAFYGCSELTTITVKATNPPSIGVSYTFYNFPKLTAIYVPLSSVDEYRSASGWSAFSDKIQAMQ